MRIAVFAPDTPFPANRGGRADVWRRIQGFRSLGHAVFLVHLYETAGPWAVSADDVQAMDRQLEGRFGFPIRRGAWRALAQLAQAWRVPRHCATRVPTAQEFAALERAIDAFAPDLLWTEGPWFGECIRRLSRGGRPYAYRSHNIEHRYMRWQAQAARRWRDRVAWSLSCIGLKDYETALMRGAQGVFDISVDDMAFWRSQGIERLHWLPPMPGAPAPAGAEVQRSEVLFVGNLATPNNVNGVEFLVAEVLPQLQHARPGLRLCVVGSRPAPAFRARLAAATGVDLHADVDDVGRFLRGAQVLVNPVMTGSGVQLKTLDMLMTDAPLVTTRQGSRGLPPAVVEQLIVADGADPFARAVLAALEQPLAPEQRRARGAVRERHFTTAALADALARMGHAADAVPAGA